MTMSPEEQFIQETWKLLQQIRLDELTNPNRMSAIVQSKTGRTGFEVYIDDGPDYIQTCNLVYKFSDWGILKILEAIKITGTVPAGGTQFIVELVYPKFGEVYALYQHGLEQGVPAGTLLEMVKEWAHPISMYSSNLLFETSLLIKGSRASKYFKGSTPKEAKPVPKQKSLTQSAATYPYAIPAETPWNKITLQFKNYFEVTVKVAGKIHETNYKGMGFENGRKKGAPNKQWWLLYELAKFGGETNKDLLGELKQAERDQLKSRKKLLAKALRAYFGLSGDPFYPYRDEKIYRIRIILLPESRSTIKGMDDVPDEDADEDQYGIREAMEEQSPQVYP
jgi:hypothetical protein